MEIAGTPQIGPVINRERKARRLTLEQLAERSGVSRSMLSQIERGEANPTFAVLWSLTRALGVELSDLVSGTVPSEAGAVVEIVSVAHTPELLSSDGACRLSILSPPELAGRTEWYRVEMASGGSLESAPHAARTMEHLTALEGEFAIESGGTARPVATGETARYRADVPHRIANSSNTPATGLLVVLFA